jgi:hypothetical protein
MRVALGAMMTSVMLTWSGAAFAQLDLCTNIRLSVSEQIECRSRLNNSLNEGDRQRTQQEFEDRIRRANDRLITPPVISGRGLTATVPGFPRPEIPSLPDTPRSASQPASPVSGSAAPGGSLPAPPAGQIAKPGEDPPSGGAIAPDLTAPDTSSRTPPISPLPLNPAGAFPPAK